MGLLPAEPACPGVWLESAHVLNNASPPNEDIHQVAEAACAPTWVRPGRHICPCTRRRQLPQPTGAFCERAAQPALTARSSARQPEYSMGLNNAGRPRPATVLPEAAETNGGSRSHPLVPGVTVWN